MTSSYPPPYPSPAPQQPGAPRKDPSGKLVLLVLGLILALVAAIAVAIVYLATRDDDGPDFPDEWDAQVAHLIPVVEELRGLEFKHPVYVDFRSEEDYRADMTSDEGELTEEDEEELEQLSGMLRALGLLETDVDLFEEMNALSSDGTLGFYSFEDKRIRVRGSELTPAVTKTLVHELVHALQDQHFDLGKRFDELSENDDSSSSLFRAVVEGDASRVETAYVESLPMSEQEAIAESEENEQGDLLEKLEEIPQILLALIGSSYALGEPLVGLAYEEGGNAAVDELFHNPPSTEEHLLDPWTWLLDQEPAIEVEAPALAEGEEEFESGEFGALFLYFVLAEQLDLVDALDAAEGWGGDQFVAFTRDEQTCIATTFVADTDEDLTEMHEALETWVGAQPSGFASVDLDGDTVFFESCDSGESRLGSDSAQDALILVTVRSTVAWQFVASGIPTEMARCFSDAIVREFAVEQLTDPEFGSDDPEVAQQMQQMAMACG